MAYLIINADDLGADIEVDRGIVDAFRNGILTSTTLLVTFAPHWEESARAAKAAGLPTGVHLSLTHGYAVAPRDRVPDLIDGQGRFAFSAGRIITMGAPTKRENADLYEQMRTELAAQIDLVQQRGFAISHLDSHQHVHMNPAIFEIVQDLAAKHSIPAVRFVRERFFGFQLRHGVVANLRRKNLLKALLVRRLAGGIIPKVRTNDVFFGVMQSDTMDKWIFTRLLRSIARTDLVWEVGMHPGFSARAPRPELQIEVNDWFASPARRSELDLLLDPEVKELIQKEHITLVSYANMP